MSGPRQSPHYRDMEESLIGACLLDVTAIESLDLLDPSDFYMPGCGLAAEAIIRLWKAGAHVDTGTVSAELLPFWPDNGTHPAAELISMQANVPSTKGAPRYAAKIGEAALRRQVIDMHASSLDPYDLAVPVDDLVDDLEARVQRIADGGVSTVDGPTHIDDFLAGDFEYDWVIPGLLERGDRAMVTGEPGIGKMTLLRQIGMMASVGLHPFNRSRFRSVRVLNVDLQESKQQNRRELAPLRRLALEVIQEQYSLDVDPDPEGVFLIEPRRQGMNLLNRADRRWFIQLIEAARPDILVIGPHYKTYQADRNDEQQATIVTEIFDDLIERYGFTLLMEAHKAKGEHMGPSGSGVWERWPEFGFGLREPADAELRDSGAVEFAHWRGPRDQDRHWPALLRRGGVGRWPWEDHITFPGRPVEPAGAWREDF